jgi:hypothetical protein
MDVIEEAVWVTDIIAFFSQAGPIPTPDVNVPIGFVGNDEDSYGTSLSRRGATSLVVTRPRVERIWLGIFVCL